MPSAMINKDLYTKIEEKYGSVASWAIWEKAGDKPKSNMSKMSVFDVSTNPSLYDTVNTNVIMAGLNFSREVEFKVPFSNFHDPSPYANDFKIRFAFEGTPFYGAYMTDVIKNFPMLNSKDVVTYLNKNPDALRENIREFKNELNYIGSKNTIILAFGSDTYKYLKQDLSTNDYQHLVKLTHYSHQISKEDYRKEVHEQIYRATGLILSKTDFMSRIDKDLCSYSESLSKITSLENDTERHALLKLKHSIKNLESTINQIDNA